MLRSLAVAVLLIPFALVGPASSARAGFVTYDSSLTTSNPVFNRPLAGTPPTGLSAVGTAVYYNLQAFRVDLSGTYVMNTEASTLDTFLVLYSGSFNPSSPLTNALAADDDGVSSFGLSQITLGLTAGTQYFLVTTTFANGVTGAITTRITGPGNPTLGTAAVAVPEPASLAMVGVGITLGLGVHLGRRRRQAVPA